VSILQPRGVRIVNQFSRNLILLVTDGPRKGHRVVIPPGESRVVGRTTASHVACEDDYMSSKHFEVCNRNETIFVRDLNSRNGTKIFDEAIQERALSQGSRITAGKSVFEVAWEQSNEDWGTHAGSSISIRRNFSSSAFPSSSQSLPSGDSSNGQSIGSIGSTGMQAEAQGLGANPSAQGSFDERIAGLCLELFHASVVLKQAVTAPIFERLYNWSKPPAAGESFLSDFYLTNLDFFAVASFSKLGVANPVNLPWYPLFPSIDPTSAVAPIAIPKRAWLEGCHMRWFERLASVDGVSFVVTDSSRSPEGILSQLNRGFRDMLLHRKRDESSNGNSEDTPEGVLPWYSPMELLTAIGTRSEESLANWIPSVVQGLVFPIRPSRLSFALVRPGIRTALRDRGFRSASDA
jgi:pSer/pThr/pTyr-binding forkhead associated (FHA) protein